MAGVIAHRLRLANGVDNRKKIAFPTPHQLSTDAKQMIRDGKSDFVKELPGKGYYKGCKQIDQEVDLETYIHIEKSNNESFLTIQRGKHRLIGQTNPKDLYCVLPFTKYGLAFDVDRADTTRKKVGGGPIGSNEETPFWETMEA
ncbi:DnaB family ATPase [Paraburkholderia sp. BCC1886]|uniref:DnaB family ATPase n=1 Tax=Paraburkholderia sp. BCC1886 TaxID=2562670 RepID=UPI0011829839|nr:DnaB family ATPase [Paraburkholderia sp. BCC1886]